MSCDEFRQNWTEWHEGECSAEQAQRMDAHVARCAACRRYDRQMAAMVGALAELPLPGTGAQEVPAAAPARGHRRGVQGLAFAATLALGVGVGLVLSTGPQAPAPTDDPAAVELAGTGVHEVQLAFESPATLERVAFVVELPPGVEMVGYPGQRTVQWEGRLAAGKSRLRLPLRVTSTEADGTLVARIVRGDKAQTLRVPMRITPDGQAAVLGTRTG